METETTKQVGLKQTNKEEENKEEKNKQTTKDKFNVMETPKHVGHKQTKFQLENSFHWHDIRKQQSQQGG